jgi:hypothetical protein
VDLWQVASNGGLGGVLIWIIWAGTKKLPLWVPGEQYREQVADLKAQVRDAKQECEEWKTLALKSTMLADRATTDATRAVTPSRPRGDSRRAKTAPEHE